MATVHPSRLGLVPNALPSRPLMHLSSSSNADATTINREEELKRKLLERRKGKGKESLTNSDKIASDDSGSDGAKHGTQIVNFSDASGTKKDMGLRIRRKSPTPPSSPPRRLRMDMDQNAPYEAESSRPNGASSSAEVRNSNGSPKESSRTENPRATRRASPNYQPYERPQSNQRRPHERKSSIGTPGPAPSAMPPFPPTLPPTSTYGYGPRRDQIGHPPHLPPIMGEPLRAGFGPTGDGKSPGPGSLPGSGYNTPPYRGGPRGGYDFERRRQERENNPLSIWPPSPKEPYVDESDLALSRKSKRKSKKTRSKKSKRYSDTESSSNSDSEDSEDDRRVRRRREIRRRRHASEFDSEEEEGRRRKKKTRERRSASTSSISPGRSGSRSRSRSYYRDVDDDDWVEKHRSRNARTVTETLQIAPVADEDSDEGEVVGPRLPVEYKDKMGRTHFRDMLPGEAEAMAKFAATGARIPRRGEIGLDSRTIEQFEQSGFVMSGSRHKKMNAVRLRKENQVINAEEKRAILVLQREERERKEGAIVASFKEMIDDTLRAQGLNRH